MPNPGRGYRNEFRIIGGRWRRRRLTFPPLPGIRPSPDRVRETLFNWLRDRIEGARCLDLFAGSGALGLEALSRGAAQVVFVDQAPEVAEALRRHLAQLQATGAELVREDALRWLRNRPPPFDLVFLDPPFDSDLLPLACQALEDNACLKDGAYIYIEYPEDRAPALPGSWRIHRQSRAGRVGYALAERRPPGV